MKTLKFAIPYAALLAALCILPMQAARAEVKATLDIDLSRKGPPIPPTFGGLMTEEINHSYDGGLFAELIQNRTFQDPPPRRPQTPDMPVHWSLIGEGKASIDRNDPVNSALPLSLRLDLSGGKAGVANDGYWGIPIRRDKKYTASFYAKGGQGFTGSVTASLVTDDGNITLAKAATEPVSSAWEKYTVTFTTGHKAPTTTKARFVLSATGTGSVTFSLVSLFPPTYRNKRGGLRPDLMKLMANLHPAFIRLPGGNYVEGSTFPTRFNWKQMIGPADQRPGHMGCWGYRSSDGFGMPEYLLWCKQLKAEPVLAVFAGYVLNGNHVEAGSPEMEQYTQEALEEIEYVSGPATSKWGKQRAADGLRKPFTLRYVEIGNEDWFDRSGSYDSRFTQMAKAIRAKYPNLKIIASAPVKSFQPDMVDDHFYRSARQLMTLARQYDPPAGQTTPLRFNGGGWNGRQPDGIQTFVGEWATQEGRPTPNLNAALADAAFIMGLEQNADAIPMECYAPLLVNVNPGAGQWGTNLIGYDALNSFGSPSYYAQSMLAKHRGEIVLSSNLKVEPVPTKQEPVPHGGIGVGTWHTQVEYTDIKVTTPDGHSLLTAASTTNIAGWQTTGGRWDGRNNTILPVNGDSESWATTGDANWTDYTIQLHARKLAGREGFIVLFHAKDNSNYRWWNVGGWGNTLARCEAADNGDRVAYGAGIPFMVETGRWYDLKLEVKGNHIRGFVDDKLVSDTNEAPASTPLPVITSATYTASSHTVFVKVVNPGSDSVDMDIRLNGVGKVESKGTAIVLAGEPSAVNTVEQPMNIAPKREAITNASTSFHKTFLPHSFTLMRLTIKP